MGKLDVNSLLNLLEGGGVRTLAASAKADEAQVTAVLSDALPVLVGKMSDNASTKEGAESLNKALNDHRTGGAIDVASFLQNADGADGQKILGHILGDDQDAATKALSKKSGLSSSKVSTILSLVAPLLLSQLGNNKKDDDASGLGGLLGGMLGSGSNSGGGLGASLLGSLLGGGSSSASSSSSSGLGGILGGLFGGKEEKEEEKEEPGSLLGGLGSLAMNLFGDSDALKEDEAKKKKTGKKTTSTGKKTTSTGKKTTSTGKKTTSTGKKTAKKKTTKK